jgi:hypothetical protein
MIGLREIFIVSLLGLLTTSSSILGAALGLYVPLSKSVLACVLALAAGALISALAIELAYEGARELHRQGFTANAAWAFIGSGFGVGAVIYYAASLFLDQKGAAIRYPTRFFEYAMGRRQKDEQERINLLSKCDLLRHLPPEEIESILPCVLAPPGRRRDSFPRGRLGRCALYRGAGQSRCDGAYAANSAAVRSTSWRSWAKGKHSARWPC